jgi:hypothetical protein
VTYMAEGIATQILDELGRAPLAEVRRLCVEDLERWVMGSDGRPYVIRARAHRDTTDRVVVRVRVDTHGWTWAAPIIRTLIVAADPQP